MSDTPAPTPTPAPDSNDRRGRSARRAEAEAQPAPDTAMTNEEKAARFAASIGAQVVLDPRSEVAAAARGAAGRTMVENVQARDQALVERAGGVEKLPVTQTVTVRDPVADPEHDMALEARGVKPPEPMPVEPVPQLVENTAGKPA
jgi:hypothetical protein